MNVQLIDVLQDRHLWANKYDITSQDSFGIDGQIAREIATALGAKLHRRKRPRVRGKPTRTLGLTTFFFKRKNTSLSRTRFFRIIGRPSNFMSRRSRLIRSLRSRMRDSPATRAHIYHFYEPTEVWKQERACRKLTWRLQLQPNLGEAHHALGLCYYWFDRDYAKALREFETARKLLAER